MGFDWKFAHFVACLDRGLIDVTPLLTASSRAGVRRFRPCGAAGETPTDPASLAAGSPGAEDQIPTEAFCHQQVAQAQRCIRERARKGSGEPHSCMLLASNTDAALISQQMTLVIASTQAVRDGPWPTISG